MLKKLLIIRMWKTTFQNPEFRQALIDSARRKALLKEKKNMMEGTPPDDSTGAVEKEKERTEHVGAGKGALDGRGASSALVRGRNEDFARLTEQMSRMQAQQGSTDENDWRDQPEAWRARRTCS